ncbi:MAG: D-2-hydroxyacid dehydrogenase family protein [Actinobacteria bacterium]|nr:D-2-hydroxyacid dehydrogenase family protein [Actinomycetota bacterium]
MRVLVLDDWEGSAQAANWAQLPEDVTIDIRRESIPASALPAELDGYQAIVVMRERTPLSRTLLARLPSLRLIVTTGARNASIDLEACHEFGITVCATDSGGSPVVEHTWALILAGLRGVPQMATGMQAGEWKGHVGRQLAGSRLGLIGLGKTGTRVARIARAFDMEVVAWSPHLTIDRAESAGTALVDKAELFATSDVISVHMVLAAATRGIVGAHELALMKSDAWLVNTSRGPLVDEAALIEVCSKGLIAGAMLDVFDTEPLPTDHPLRTTPRLLLTPHAGYLTRETLDGWYADVIDDLLAYLAGSPIRILDTH